ncbi:hypothetical protein FGO68_gene1333 [Halteria grandinella]|uniref:Uncharacterized protein n=1 Tax=Halteria grandinella TaxID=5974 RepID=A0A8J8P680_HALGN|nr:hypothetical protein FGO68_gene1333 [Halteria grandinella]
MWYKEEDGQVPKSTKQTSYIVTPPVNKILGCATSVPSLKNINSSSQNGYANQIGRNNLMYKEAYLAQESKYSQRLPRSFSKSSPQIIGTQHQGQQCIFSVPHSSGTVSLRDFQQQFNQRQGMRNSQNLKELYNSIPACPDDELFELSQPSRPLPNSNIFTTLKENQTASKHQGMLDNSNQLNDNFKKECVEEFKKDQNLYKSANNQRAQDTQDQEGLYQKLVDNKIENYQGSSQSRIVIFKADEDPQNYQLINKNFSITQYPKATNQQQTISSQLNHRMIEIVSQQPSLTNDFAQSSGSSIHNKLRKMNSTVCVTNLKKEEGNTSLKQSKRLALKRQQAQAATCSGGPVKNQDGLATLNMQQESCSQVSCEIQTCMARRISGSSCHSTLSSNSVNGQSSPSKSGSPRASLQRTKSSSGANGIRKAKLGVSPSLKGQDEQRKTRDQKRTAKKTAKNLTPLTQCDMVNSLLTILRSEHSIVGDLNIVVDRLVNKYHEIRSNSKQIHNNIQPTANILQVRESVQEDETALIIASASNVHQDTGIQQSDCQLDDENTPQSCRSINGSSSSLSFQSDEYIYDPEVPVNSVTYQIHAPAPMNQRLSHSRYITTILLRQQCLGMRSINIRTYISTTLTTIVGQYRQTACQCKMIKTFTLGTTAPKTVKASRMVTSQSEKHFQESIR